MAKGRDNSGTVSLAIPPIRASGDGANQHRGMTVTKDLNTGLRFGFLIHDVSRLRRVVVDRALKPLGITRSQWWVLAFLSRRDGMTQTALASDLDLTKVAIGGLLISEEHPSEIQLLMRTPCAAFWLQK